MIIVGREIELPGQQKHSRLIFVWESSILRTTQTHKFALGSCALTQQQHIRCATRGQGVLLHAANAKFAVHTRPSCATAALGQGVLHAANLCNTRHSAKVCYTLQICATRCKAVQHDAKFTVHARPRFATRCKSVQHAANAKFIVHTRPRCATCRKAVKHAAFGQGVLHAAKLCNTRHSAEVCYTLQSCATGGQFEIHCAHAAKVCYTLQSCATRGQYKIHCAHAAKVCYTLQSCATRGTRPRCAAHGRAVQHGQAVLQAAKLCNTPKQNPLRPCAHPLFCHSATLLL
jgi:hypothetical protein